MLQNASLLAIVAVDTEENERIKDKVWWVRHHFFCIGGGGHQGRGEEGVGAAGGALRAAGTRRCEEAAAGASLRCSFL